MVDRDLLITSDEEMRKNILRRLRRIEGQVKGIQRMIEEKKPCQEILPQVAAVRAALNTVGTMIFKNYSVECLRGASLEQQQEKIEELMQAFLRFTR